MPTRPQWASQIGATSNHASPHGSQAQRNLRSTWEPGSATPGCVQSRPCIDDDQMAVAPAHRAAIALGPTSTPRRWNNSDWAIASNELGSLDATTG